MKRCVLVVRSKISIWGASVIFPLLMFTLAMPVYFGSDYWVYRLFLLSAIISGILFVVCGAAYIIGIFDLRDNESDGEKRYPAVYLEDV